MGYFNQNHSIDEFLLQTLQAELLNTEWGECSSLQCSSPDFLLGSGEKPPTFPLLLGTYVPAESENHLVGKDL